MGDALGSAVEFMRLEEIRRRFGPGGIREYAKAYGRLGGITDDTQMTLFTAEGLIRGLAHESYEGISSYSRITANAYLRWLLTQGESNQHGLDPLGSEPGWLYTLEALHTQRAPGLTCLGALKDAVALGQPARNNSKGCGGVMRVAPVGLFARSNEESFQLGCELAALTHGHPTGWLAAGAFAVMIMSLRQGEPLGSAVGAALDCLSQQPRHHETSNALEQAAALAASGFDTDEAIARLGLGWIAEEALAIATYCALKTKDFQEAVVMAVNHDGDSDSTGAIAGNLLGLVGGEQCIPSEWLEPLELREAIAEMADDLLDCREWFSGPGVKDKAFNKQISRKYPGY